MKPMFKDKTLLVIAPHYMTFIKNQVEAAADYFDRVYVLCPENIFKKGLRGTTEKNNVFLFFPRFFHLPLNFFRKRLGQTMGRCLLSFINRKKITFDLVHAHFTWAYGEAGRIVAAEKKSPFAVTAHGGDIYHLPFINDWWNRVIKKVVNAADAVITVSGKNLEYLKMLEVIDKSTLITNGFVEKKFYPRSRRDTREQLGIDQERQVIVTVGNLEEVKNHITLIKACKELKKEFPRLSCYIIGSGSLKKQLQQAVINYSLADRVFLTGGKPHEQIPLWLNSADLAVLTSHYEGNPTIMFEALGCGIPFISSKVGGVGEIIISKEYGLLYDRSSDYMALADLIREGLQKKWNPEAIAGYGKKFAASFLNSQLLEVYKRVLYGK